MVEKVAIQASTVRKLAISGLSEAERERANDRMNNADSITAAVAEALEVVRNGPENQGQFVSFPARKLSTLAGFCGEQIEAADSAESMLKHYDIWG